MAAHRLRITVLLAFSGLLGYLPGAFGQDLQEEAIQRLAQKIGRRPLAMSWQNLSTMPPEEADLVRKRVEGLFENNGSGIETKATLSENPKGYLIILQAGEGKIYIEAWPKPPAKPEQPPFQLKITHLGESPRPILDAAVSPDGKTVVLLESFRVASPDGRSAGLGLPRPLPRDPRGRVQVTDAGEIRAQLPGMRCTGSFKRMQCAASDDAWIVPGRNYFKGARGLYYSSAEIDGDVFQSELDGHTRLYVNQTEPARVLENWASEMAPIESSCGAKVQLVTSLETEQAQAFESVGGHPRPSTAPVATDGPIVAMWQASDRRNEVTMVVRNRTKRIYEASRLAISCTH